MESDFTLIHVYIKGKGENGGDRGKGTLQD